MSACFPETYGQNQTMLERTCVKSGPTIDTIGFWFLPLGCPAEFVVLGSLVLVTQHLRTQSMGDKASKASNQLVI